MEGMRARQVHSFTRGGNPYRKLGVGRHREPPTYENIEFVVHKIYSHWFNYGGYSTDSKGDGITAFTFTDDDGHGYSVQMEVKRMEMITKHKRIELQHRILDTLEQSGIRYRHSLDFLTYNIYLYYQWE